MHPLRWLKQNKAMACILLAYLCVSLALLASWHAVTPLSNPDSYSYLNTAQHLKKDHFFTEDGTKPETFRTPGYPLMIWAVSLVSESMLAISILQILLVTLALLLMYLVILRATRSRAAGCVACGAMLFDFLIYWHSQTILSEVPFMCFLVFALYFLSKYIYDGNRFIWLLLFALALNFALLIRPILSYFNLLFCLLLLGLAVLKKVSWRHALCFALVFGLVYFGWSYRNYLRTNAFIYSSVRDFNLLHWDAAHLLERVERIPKDQLYYGTDRMGQLFAEKMQGADLSALSEPQLHKLFAKVGSAYIRAHFGEYIMQNIEGALQLLFYPAKELIGMVVKAPWLYKLLCLAYAGFLLLVHGAYVLGYAVKFLWRRQRPSALDVYIFLLIAYQVAASASLGFSRFRIPFFPLELVAIGMNLPLVRRDSRAHSPAPLVEKRL